MKTKYKIFLTLAASVIIYSVGFIHGTKHGKHVKKENIEHTIFDITQAYADKARHWDLNPIQSEAIDKARFNFHDLSYLLVNGSSCIDSVIKAQFERENQYAKIHGTRVNTSEYNLVPKLLQHP